MRTDSFVLWADIAGTGLWHRVLVRRGTDGDGDETICGIRRYTYGWPFGDVGFYPSPGRGGRACPDCERLIRQDQRHGDPSAGGPRGGQ